MSGWLLSAAFASLMCGAEAQQDPLSTFSMQRQFLNALETQREENRIDILRSEQEVLQLESQAAAKEAEAARTQRELSRLNTLPAPTIMDQLEQTEARHRLRSALEQTKSDRARLDAELERRERERTQLGDEKEELDRLASEYQSNPQHAGRLLRELRSK